MKKYFLMFLVLTVIFFTCASAYAMSGLEFMSSPASEKRKVLEPIILDYVAKGYKKVPSWSRLSNKIESVIREKGWGSKNIKSIALDASEGLGMSQ
jgi:hypothetical protein